MQGLDHLKSRVIFKFPFQNSLFLEDPLMLKWPFSDTILVTAYDLLKKDSMLSRMQREGSTLREYFIEKGFNKDIKIMADTGIFAFEFRKAKLDGNIPIEVPDKLINRDIFTAYELIDPDYLVAPDEIILWGDSYKQANTKLKIIENNLLDTLDKFDKNKVFAVLQGIDTEQMTKLTDVFENLGIKNVARGGLLPLMRKKAAFQRLVRESEELSRGAGVENLHGFGMPGVYSLPDYFIDNSYDTIDTSTIYYYTKDRRYLDRRGQLIPVKNASFTGCRCEPCMNMLDLRSRTRSGNFILNLYAHNSFMVLKLLDELMKDQEYLKRNRGKFYRRKIINKDIIENYEDILTTAGRINYKSWELMDKSEVHKSRVQFLRGKKMGRKVLVISSCSKIKRYSVENQAECSRLDTPEKRKRERGLLADILLPAKDLYQGYQHKSIIRSLRYLRKQFDVDHYIISAGFGLIREDEYIPPYDCTFGDRSPREVEKMRDSLLLVENIKKLKGYDLVYLAMGRDYIAAFGGIDTFKDLGNEVIYYSEDREVNGNLVGFTREEFSMMEEESVKFNPKIDFNPSIMGNLLQNFARSGKRSFVEYWHSLVECNCEK